MQQTLTRSLIETIVKSKLEDLKKSPERTTRNLVDMALHFSKGRFQKRFFEIAQTMLEDENCLYYQMVYHMVANVDNNRLLTFGMNLGYNSCTYGAKIIRKTETDLGFNVPWCITLELSEKQLYRTPEHYHKLLQEGKSLGIYTWHIFSNECMMEFLPIIEMNPECAFFIYCHPSELNDDVLESYMSIRNVIFVVQYNEKDTSIYHLLKDKAFLYASYFIYQDTDVPDILNDDLLCEINETHSSFVVFISDKNCSDETKERVAIYARNAIDHPLYRTIPFDFHYHSSKIDAIISDDSCSVGFDRTGSLSSTPWNHFDHSLSHILKNAFPKKS